MKIDKTTCMLATAPSGAEGRNIDDWLLEPKYDGHRHIASVTDGKVRMFARSGVDKTGKLPLVEAALSRLPDCVLDGEIIAPAGWGRVQEILGAQSRTATDLSFMVFDVLEVMGTDVRSRPLTERRQMLELIVQHFTDEDPVEISPQMPFSQETVAEFIDAGWEGMIAKRPSSTYQSGRRSPDWLKFKGMATEDVEVMGTTEGEGKFSGLIGALVFGQVEDGVLVRKGQCSGMTDDLRVKFTEMRDEGTLNGLIIEVRHMGVHPTGGWKSAQFKRIRYDKMEETS